MCVFTLDFLCVFDILSLCSNECVAWFACCVDTTLCSKYVSTRISLVLCFDSNIYSMSIHFGWQTHVYVFALEGRGSVRVVLVTTDLDGCNTNPGRVRWKN